MLARYNLILEAIQKFCPTAHIAGGAVRDTLLERPIKDIDLFLDEAATDEAAALLRSKFGFVKVGEWASYEMFSDRAVKRVCNFDRAGETIPLTLIGLNLEYIESDYVFDMKTNLDRFDFGICMAGWDGDEVYTSDEFRRDLELKTFTLCRADNQPQFNYSMSRFEKMVKDRYAGWQLAVPKQFEAMAKEYALKRSHYFDDETDMWMPREIVGKQMLSPKPR